MSSKLGAFQYALKAPFMVQKNDKLGFTEEDPGVVSMDLRPQCNTFYRDVPKDGKLYFPVVGDRWYAFESPPQPALFSIAAKIDKIKS